jgi:hypothetical protein
MHYARLSQGAIQENTYGRFKRCLTGAGEIRQRFGSMPLGAEPDDAHFDPVQQARTAVCYQLSASRSVLFSLGDQHENGGTSSGSLVARRSRLRFFGRSLRTLNSVSCSGSGFSTRASRTISRLSTKECATAVTSRARTSPTCPDPRKARPK